MYYIIQCHLLWSLCHEGLNVASPYLNLLDCSEGDTYSPIITFVPVVEMEAKLAKKK